MIVSDLFADVYQNWNVFNQVKKAKKLCRPERLLMLMASVDFDIDNQFVILNFRSFGEEIEILKQFYFDKNPLNLDLLSILNKTPNGYQRIISIFDRHGNRLLPLTEEEAKIKRREYLINIINK